MNYVRLQWLLVIIVTKYGLGIGLGKGWDQSLGQELELWLGIGLPGYLDFVFRVRVGTSLVRVWVWNQGNHYHQCNQKKIRPSANQLNDCHQCYLINVTFDHAPSCIQDTAHSTTARRKEWKDGHVTGRSVRTEPYRLQLLLHVIYKSFSKEVTAAVTCN